MLEDQRNHNKQINRFRESFTDVNNNNLLETIRSQLSASHKDNILKKIARNKVEMGDNRSIQEIIKQLESKGNSYIELMLLDLVKNKITKIKKILRVL